PLSVKFSSVVGALLAFVLAAGCASIVGADFERPGAGELAEAGSAEDAEGQEGASVPESATAGCARDAAAGCAGKCGRLKGRCAQALDCGGCPSDPRCGGGGPNVCGEGACTPTCAGKRCGESDGCAGLCSADSCGAGFACVDGACVCGDANHA